MPGMRPDGGILQGQNHQITIKIQVVYSERGHQMQNDVTEEYWSRFADSYDENQEYVVGKDFIGEIDREFSRLPNLGKTVELGCGTGVFTELITPKTMHLVATDLSNELLALARERLNNHPKVVIQKENCMATSFAPGAFDSVFMANLIHVVENPDKVLLECHRIIRIGGKVIIVTYTNFGMHLLDKIKLGLRFFKAWGKPPKHTHIFHRKALLLRCKMPVLPLRKRS
jgi:ABC-2 type transport system ATP-binding protein